MIHLEPIAAQAGHAMLAAEDSPKGQENLITKALMVLAEQGIFALGLFLVSQSRREDAQRAERIHGALAQLMADAGIADAAQPAFSPAYYRQLTAGQEAADLAQVLLTKQLLETALTYGRYHAKGLPRHG